MGNKLDLLGKRFGRLTVIEESGRSRCGDVMWVCRCDCGNITKPIKGSSLIHGLRVSCGCRHAENAKTLNRTHGKSKTRLYLVWNGMKTRCTNPNHSSYKFYGARGIQVCGEWANDYKAFYDWAMSHGYEEVAEYGACTIDRIDFNGNYCPENCRWITIQEQQLNKRKPSKRK